LTQSPLKALIAAQADLIGALDSQDAVAIETATLALQERVAAMRNPGAWRDGPEAQAQLDHALKQSEAARARVNILSLWTRQKIDRLTEIRGSEPGMLYGKGLKSAISVER
jgi:hypothetical protein